MSILAKIFKCCRCNGGDPPDPCGRCCSLFGIPKCGCCYGSTLDRQTLDEVVEYKAERHFRASFEHFIYGDVLQQMDWVTVQNGKSTIKAEFDCWRIVPISFTYYFFEMRDGVIEEETQCFGTGFVNIFLGLADSKCFSWDSGAIQAGGNITDVSCTKGFEADAGDKTFLYDIVGQKSQDTCDAFAHHAIKQRAHGQPRIITIDASGNIERHVFGCVESNFGGGCGCEP